LHDIDIGSTAGDLARHGVVGAQIVRELGFSAAVVHAVNAHDNRAGVPRTSRLDHALYCADQVYWLITATGLKFTPEGIETALPEKIWEQIQAMSSKATILGAVRSECAEIGLNMPQAIAAAHAALRKLAPDAVAR